MVSKTTRSHLMDNREAHLILFEITNHPVCAATPSFKTEGMNQTRMISCAEKPISQSAVCPEGLQRPRYPSPQRSREVSGRVCSWLQGQHHGL